MLSANPFKKSRTSHFFKFPSSRFYRLLDLSTCPSRVSIACCILSKVWDQVWDDHQIGVEGRRALVEMSPTELLSQNPNASNIFAPTLGKISKKLSSMKLHKHGKSMVSARQAVLSRRNGPSSNDDNADDDIKPISSTCSSQAWILSVNVSQE